MNGQSAAHILGGGGFGGRSRRGGGGGGGGFGGGGGGAGVQGGGESEHNPIEALIALYNSLWQAKPELGQLIVEGDLAKPSVVVFHCDVQRRPLIDNSDFKMKAFALNGIPPKEWEQLEDLVDSELNKLALLQIERSINTGEPLSDNETRHLDMEIGKARESRVTLHKDTGLLIVRGSQSILDAADSLVTAWRAKQPVKF
jgi:hypothetical protein